MAAEPGRELLILGVLRRGPLSAYELTRTVKMHGPLYKSLASGNIYEQLANWEKRGWIRSRQAPAARGPRKTKTVYELSASGRRRFDVLLAGLLDDPQVPDATLEVAFVLLGQFSRDRATKMLQQRLAALVAQQKRLSRLYGKPDERSGAALLAMTHAMSRIEADVVWTKGALANLRDARWKPEWVADDEATATGRR